MLEVDIIIGIVQTAAYWPIAPRFAVDIAPAPTAEAPSVEYRKTVCFITQQRMIGPI